ncbi:hexose transporter [Melanomma pulvis-pyrius CBS 109.77]|uniref:Hexose transporter n=1 Tax=Melanomma pulvis-pyrius CBS 109.77 TaxID=1314802 RepID=A0A6A6XIF1_9PLEO|nr:hexose transporter [Melanomma pulvis-pyrius CBS 109.77]
MTWMTALVISVCVVDSVTIAYDGSLMGSLNVMPSYSKYFHLTTTLKSLNTAITFVGAIPVALTAGPLINWKGRKFGIILSACIQIIGAILQGSAQHIAMFIIGRLFIGAGSGLAQASASTYVAETVPSRVRAFALGLYFTCWAVGSLLAAGTAQLTSTWAWRIPSLLQAAPSIAALIVLFFLPESPRWLAYNDRHEEAVTVLAQLHGKTEDDPIVQVQLREIMDTLQYEKDEGKSVNYFELFKTPGNRKRVFLALSVAPLAMLTGSNIITFYFGTMLSQAGIKNPKTQLKINVILSAWQLIVALSGSLSAEKIGRKVLCLTSLGLAAITLFMVGGLTATYGESTEKSGIYGTVASIFLFLGAYSFGITPLTVMYGPEVLSYSLRATGMGLFTTFSKSCGLLVTFAFPHGFESIGWKMYMINASFNVLLWGWIAYYWVETKGHTLEEIDAIFDGEKHSDVPDLDMVARGKAEVLIEEREM